MINKVKRIWAISSRKRYVKYLRKLGGTIGENVYFVSPRNTFFDYNRALYISIGNECVICNGVSFNCHDYSWTIPMKALYGIYPSGGEKISIGNNCFIGENATLLKGITIGDNVIVATGSVVTKSCESNSVYAGVPAKRIMGLDEYTNKLKRNYLGNFKNTCELFLNKLGRLPREYEMRNFSFLYLDRSKSSEEKIRNMSWIGCDRESVVKLFYSTSSYKGVSSYEELLEKVLSEKEG